MSELTYYAQLDNNNLVVSVHVVSAAFMAENPDRYPGTWVETFYNSPTKTYAGIGYTYDPTTDTFTPPPVVEDAPE